MANLGLGYLIYNLEAYLGTEKPTYNLRFGAMGVKVIARDAVQLSPHCAKPPGR